MKFPLRLAGASISASLAVTIIAASAHNTRAQIPPPTPCKSQGYEGQYETPIPNIVPVFNDDDVFLHYEWAPNVGVDFNCSTGQGTCKVCVIVQVSKDTDGNGSYETLVTTSSYTSFAAPCGQTGNYYSFPWWIVSPGQGKVQIQIKAAPPNPTTGNCPDVTDPTQWTVLNTKEITFPPPP